MTDETLPFSLLRLAKDRLNVSDADLADVIGTSRPHVQAIVSGRYKESLSVAQVEALIAYASIIRDEMAGAVAELEMLA